jgi:hypothetical protein
VILEESKGLDQGIGGLRGGINRGVGREEADLYSLLSRLVISTDSIAQNADFVAFE